MLFSEILFGPVQSRRFGRSLGINLLPLDNKVCNFDCIYCECGWTDLHAKKIRFLPAEKVIEAMEYKLNELKSQGAELDALTFAGNGEPTMHPEFLSIMKSTCLLRDTYFPDLKIVVLSNAVLINRAEIRETLALADLRILKLDAGTEAQFQRIDRSQTKKPLQWLVQQLAAFNKPFWIQTLLLKGSYDGADIDNSNDFEVQALISQLKRIQPEHVMLYTLDRPTPAKFLEKIAPERMEEIAKKIHDEGFSVNVYT